MEGLRANRLPGQICKPPNTTLVSDAVDSCSQTDYPMTYDHLLQGFCKEKSRIDNETLEVMAVIGCLEVGTLRTDHQLARVFMYLKKAVNGLV